MWWYPQDQEGPDNLKCPPENLHFLRCSYLKVHLSDHDRGVTVVYLVFLVLSTASRGTLGALPEAYCFHENRIFQKTKEPGTMEAVTSSPSFPGQRRRFYITLRIFLSSFSTLISAFLALLLAGLHHLKVSMSCI